MGETLPAHGCSELVCSLPSTEQRTVNEPEGLLVDLRETFWPMITLPTPELVSSHSEASAYGNSILIALLATNRHVYSIGITPENGRENYLPSGSD